MITHGPPLWPHQKEALSFIHRRRGSLLWVPMRAGKTRIAIDYIQNTGPGPDLVICPHKVIPVWLEQFDTYLLNRHAYSIRGLATQTIAERAATVKEIIATGTNKIFVVNYDVIAEEPLAKELLKIKWNRLIFDEVHRLQAPAGKQSRFAARLAKNARKVIGLSGTPGNPLGNPDKQAMRDAGILDLYGVMRTLAPGHFAWTNKAYKATFGVWNQFTPFPKIEGYINHRLFDAKLASVCYHVTEDQLAYTMPEAIEQVRPVTLPPAVQATYDALERQMITEWEGDVTTAANALVKQLRIQQMTAGFLQADGADAVQAVHTVKIDAIKEIIGDIAPTERVLIFSQFKPEMDALTHALRSPARPVFHIRGGEDTSDKWKATPGAILIVQIQAGGEGLDLSMTNYCIYSSLCHSLRAFQQSFKRPQKPSAKHPIAYYYIVATGTIDEDIQRALANRAAVVDSVRQRFSSRRTQNHGYKETRKDRTQSS
ncbi:MAG TPA: DEAD/DEAH box helicase [Armatimonadota bacterium]|nr:DEAD/DEAH box helicase [Armatimonadota bacterium]